MDFQNMTIMAVFLGGMLSFLSPCVLPLLPTFSAVLAGSVDDKPQKLYINTFCFLLGFTLIFIAMGATASLVGKWFFDYQPLLKKIGAIVIILMGAFLSGLIQIKSMEREYRPFLKKAYQGPFSSFLLGMAFTIGWTPCTGPILATVLLYAGGAKTLGMGSFLLLVYAMGFSIPFFLLAVVLRKYIFSIRIIYKFLPKIQKAAGYILIIIGIFAWLGWIEKGLGFLLSSY
jgi:cytochrome c-type biogenesis protein